MVKDKNVDNSCKRKTLAKFDQVLGLGLDKVKKSRVTIPAGIKKLAQEREVARKNKDWGKADELRKEIKEKGFIIEDTSEGAKIKKK